MTTQPWRADLRRPFLRDRAARRHQADVGAGEIVIFERFADKRLVAEGNLRADRARRGERDDFIGGKPALGEDIEHFAPDIPGRADDGDLETHFILHSPHVFLNVSCFLMCLNAWQKSSRKAAPCIGDVVASRNGRMPLGSAGRVLPLRLTRRGPVNAALTLFATNARLVMHGQCSDCTFILAKTILAKTPPAIKRRHSAKTLHGFAVLTNVMEISPSVAGPADARASPRNGGPASRRANRPGRFPWRVSLICLAITGFLYAFPEWNGTRRSRLPAASSVTTPLPTFVEIPNPPEVFRLEPPEFAGSVKLISRAISRGGIEPEAAARTFGSSPAPAETRLC